MAVTLETIATALAQPTPTTTSTTGKQWTMWISDATRAITRRAEQLDIPVESIDTTDFDYVEREAVVAQVKRPDDATQVSVAVDDGSTMKTYKSGKGRVTILDEWWELLGLTDPDEAFVIDMAPRPATMGFWPTYPDDRW